MISRATAQRFWPGADPIGQTLEMRLAADSSREGQLPQGRLNVIGVVEDVVQGTLFHGIPATFVYFPAARATTQPLSLLARGRGDVAATVDAIYATIEEAYPNAPLQVRPIRDLAALQVWAIGSLSAAAAIPGARWAASGVYRHLRCRRVRRRAAAPRVWRTGRARRDVRSHRTRHGGRRASHRQRSAPALVRCWRSRCYAPPRPLLELIPTFGLRSYVMAGAIVLGALVIAAWLPSARAARMDPAAALRAE